MYTAKDAITFADVETEMKGLFDIKEEHKTQERGMFMTGKITGFTNSTKSAKRVIGDMSHTYLIRIRDMEILDDVVRKYVEGNVKGLRLSFPDTHFSLIDWKPKADGVVYGFYLRVGAIPPTDVPLSQPAIDAMLENAEA